MVRLFSWNHPTLDSRVSQRRTRRTCTAFTCIRLKAFRIATWHYARHCDGAYWIWETVAAYHGLPAVRCMAVPDGGLS
jgi:hypothetical protein